MIALQLMGEQLAAEVRERRGEGAPPVHFATAEGLAPPRLRPRTRVAPRYPLRARIRKASGTVVLQGVVDTDGRLTELEMLSTVYGFGFEKAALAAVRQWRYEPGTIDDEPVDVLITLTIRFGP